MFIISFSDQHQVFLDDFALTAPPAALQRQQNPGQNAGQNQPEYLTMHVHHNSGRSTYCLNARSCFHLIG